MAENKGNFFSVAMVTSQSSHGLFTSTTILFCQHQSMHVYYQGILKDSVISDRSYNRIGQKFNNFYLLLAPNITVLY